MAKTGKKKRVIHCSVCGDSGHNARTCKQKKSNSMQQTTTESDNFEESSIARTISTTTSSAEDKFNSRVVVDDPINANVSVPQREAPTKGRTSDNDVAPYQCPACNEVDILAIVKVKDHPRSFKQQRDVYKCQTRCVNCLNKPTPSDLILKWGARPDEVVPIPDQDD